ncbi:50S ribosomal protein L1 [bacterium]|nr:50S ribosomal protein L1 [bacterium]
MKVSKRVENNYKKVDRNKDYSLEEAVNLLKTIEGTKFDETFEAHVNLGVDPKHADQNIRGTVSYPHGTGRQVRVLVMTKSKQEEAQKAGADYVGVEDYIEKIQKGWNDADVIIATPDTMGQVGKLGRILGPKGLMPNPKTGTVTMDIEATVKEIKAGRIEIRVDKNGIIHTPVGKKSFSIENLADNIKTLIATLMRMRPPATKGVYFKKLTLTTTMGPGVRVDKTTVL